MDGTISDWPRNTAGLIDRISHEFTVLDKNKFTGETVLRFSGSHFDGLFRVPRDFKDDDKPAQDIKIVLRLFSLCHNAGAFGSMTLIWHTGIIKNYTVKLTFQGESVRFMASNIFRLKMGERLHG